MGIKVGVLSSYHILGFMSSNMINWFSTENEFYGKKDVTLSINTLTVL